MKRISEFFKNNKRKIALGTIGFVGFVVIKLLENTNSNSKDVNSEITMDSIYPTCRACGSKMTEFDGVFWYTCPECEEAVRIVDGSETWQSDIFREGTKEIYSDMQLYDICRGGELSEVD